MYHTFSDLSEKRRNTQLKVHTGFKRKTDLQTLKGTKWLLRSENKNSVFVEWMVELILPLMHKTSMNSDSDLLCVKRQESFFKPLWPSTTISFGFRWSKDLARFQASGSTGTRELWGPQQQELMPSSSFIITQLWMPLIHVSLCSSCRSQESPGSPAWLMGVSLGRGELSQHSRRSHQPHVYWWGEKLPKEK